MGSLQVPKQRNNNQTNSYNSTKEKPDETNVSESSVPIRNKSSSYNLLNNTSVDSKQEGSKTRQANKQKRKADSIDALTSPPKKSKYDVKDVDGSIKIHGRPTWLGAAKSIKVSNTQDRCHVLGWAEFIKPNLEKAIDEIRKECNSDEEAAVEIISGIAEIYKLGKKETLSKLSLIDLTKKLATWLNSSPNNLNPKNKQTNQAIEVVGNQTTGVLKKIEEKVKNSEDGIITHDEVKAEIMSVFKDTKSQPTNDIRVIIREIIEQVEKDDTVNLIRTLNDVKTSTKIDLSNKDNAKDQTSYALTLVEKCSKLQGRKLLEELFNLRQMPSEP